MSKKSSKKSTNVPTGQWTDVKRGMTIAEGCYVDDKGVMRLIENNAPAVWHHKSTCKNHQPPCDKRITDAKDIVYDDNGAPWCSNCIGWTLEDIYENKGSDSDRIEL